MFYWTFGPIYILKSSVLLHFCRSGPTVFRKSASDQDGCTAELSLTLHRTLWEIHIKTILSGTSSSIRTKLWRNSHWIFLFQNCVRQSRSSHQDGHHSAVALLLKAALLQVSDYRLLGGSGLFLGPVKLSHIGFFAFMLHVFFFYVIFAIVHLLQGYVN